MEATISHNVNIKGVEINDIVALRRAIKNIKGRGVNISLDETAKSFRTYSGQPSHCDMAIRLPDSNHDVGLLKDDKGNYKLVFDPYTAGRRGIEDNIGAAGDAVFCPTDPNVRNVGALMQEYALCKCEENATREGHITERVTGKGGVVELVVSVA